MLFLHYKQNSTACTSTILEHNHIPRSKHGRHVSCETPCPRQSLLVEREPLRRRIYSKRPPGPKTKIKRKDRTYFCKQNREKHVPLCTSPQMNWVKFNILVGIYQLWIRLKPYLRILSLAKNNIGAEQLLTEIAAIDCRFSGLMGYMRTEGKNIPMLQAPARKTTHTLQTPPTLQSAQTLQKTQRLTFGYSTTANQSPVEWVRQSGLATESSSETAGRSMERATSSIVNSVVCAFERYISIAKQDQFLKESLELAKGNNCSAVAMCMGLEQIARIGSETLSLMQELSLQMGQSPANKKQEALIHRMLRKTNEHHQHIERVYQEVKKSLMAETTKQKEQEGQRCSEDNNVVRRKAGNHALQSHGLKESEQRLRQETVALDKCKRGKDQIKQGNDLIRQGNDRIKQVNDRIKQDNNIDKPTGGNVSSLNSLSKLQKKSFSRTANTHFRTSLSSMQGTLQQQEKANSRAGTRLLQQGCQEQDRPGQEKQQVYEQESSTSHEIDEDENETVDQCQDSRFRRRVSIRDSLKSDMSYRRNISLLRDNRFRADKSDQDDSSNVFSGQEDVQGKMVSSSKSVGTDNEQKIFESIKRYATNHRFTKRRSEKIVQEEQKVVCAQTEQMLPQNVQEAEQQISKREFLRKLLCEHQELKNESSLNRRNAKMLVVLNQLRVNGVISKEEHEIFIRKIILPARGKLSLDGKGIIMLKKHIRPLESIGSSYGELILIRKIMAETQCINQLDTRADSRVHLKEDRYEIPDWGCHFKKATIDPSEPVKHKNKVTQKQSRQNELIEQALRQMTAHSGNFCQRDL